TGCSVGKQSKPYYNLYNSEDRGYNSAVPIWYSAVSRKNFRRRENRVPAGRKQTQYRFSNTASTGEGQKRTIMEHLQINE
ncbi:MAG: hypothetical protein J6W67_06690, partial [Lentisphaeria bacterium]|nr:hypothetical protein [Lentisphaeria bacterium]